MKINVFSFMKINVFSLSYVCISSQVDLPQGQSCCSSPCTQVLHRTRLLKLSRVQSYLFTDIAYRYFAEHCKARQLSSCHPVGSGSGIREGRDAEVVCSELRSGIGKQLLSGARWANGHILSRESRGSQLPSQLIQDHFGGKF